MFRRRPETPDLVAMRAAGRVVAEMHEVTRSALRPGVTTNDLDRLAREVLDRRGATSNFLGYHGFPAVICASPNEVVVHGIPDDVPLEDGDIVSIDCGAIIDGWHGDAAYTAPVGRGSSEDLALIANAEASLAAAIEVTVAGNTIGDIGHAVQQVVEAAGYSVVREYTGHGIGTAMHMPPDIPNWGKPGRGKTLVSGQVLAVEPMTCAGAPEVIQLDDGWTVVTCDGRRAAHVEQTIAILDDGPEILTRL